MGAGRTGEEVSDVILYEAPHRLVEDARASSGASETDGYRLQRADEKYETAFTTILEEAAVLWEHEPKGECVCA